MENTSGSVVTLEEPSNGRVGMRAGCVAVSGIAASDPPKGRNSRPSRRVGTSRPRAFFCHFSRRMGHLRAVKVDENEKIHKRRNPGVFYTRARGERRADR